MTRDAKGGLRAWAPWLLVAVVVAVGLSLGASHRPAPLSLDQRTRAIAGQIRCPSCEDLTAAESNSVGAVAVRDLIRSDLSRGMSAGQIDSYLVDRYGPDILLRPSGRGLSGLVWWLPGLVALVALAGALLALRRWRPADRPDAPDAGDRLLVEQALEQGR